MSEHTSPFVQNKSPFIKVDGTIPVWGVVLLGVAWASYSWTTMSDHDKRLSNSEQSIIELRKKNEAYEVQQKDALALLNRTSTDVQVVKELLIRMEKRLDPK